jgi:nucleoside-diphosphate-sugar epimerase
VIGQEQLVYEESIVMGKFLVAGGRGFIGAALSDRLLHNGHTVVSIDSGLFNKTPIFNSIEKHPELIDYQGNAADEILLSNLSSAGSGFDAVINCAGPARPNFYLKHPAFTATTLSQVTRALLEFCKVSHAKYVHCSSSEVYGSTDGDPISEGLVGRVDPLSLRASYAEAKRFNETLFFSYVREYGIRGIILRLFNIYGPGFGDDDDRVIPEFLRALSQGRPLPIHGDGQQMRSFCHITDAATALQAAIFCEGISPACINIGNPEPIAILQLAKILSKQFDRPFNCEWHASRPDEINSRIPDISYANLLLGWRPTVSLDEGLQACVAKAELPLQDFPVDR